MYHVLTQKTVCDRRKERGKRPASLTQSILDSLLGACHFAFCGTTSVSEFLFLFPFVHGKLLCPVSCSSSYFLLFEMFLNFTSYLLFLLLSYVVFYVSYLCNICSVYVSDSPIRLSTLCEGLLPLYLSPYPLALTIISDIQEMLSECLLDGWWVDG